MKKILNLSFFYLILGLSMGVFYREFTKLNGFDGITTLKSIHSHTLVLGFIFFILILLLENNFEISKNKYFSKWLIAYNVSLLYTIITLTLRGISQVLSFNIAGLSHIAGLGHLMLGVSLIFFVVILKKSVNTKLTTSV